MTSAIAASAPLADWRARLLRDWGGRLWLFSLLVLGALVAADFSVPVDSRLHLLLVDALLPLLDAILSAASEQGAEKAMVAMSHRGRLNVMVHIVGRAAADVFARFEDVDPRSILGGGAVK